MDKIRVSKSIMDALNATGYAWGKRYGYRVKEKLSPNCIIVDRFPLYYHHDGVGEGWRACTLEYAKRNGLAEVLQVKGA